MENLNLCVIYLFFIIDQNLYFLFTSITNEVRYRNSVLQCYTFVMQCSSGFFLSSLVTASRLLDGNEEPLVSWRRRPKWQPETKYEQHVRGWSILFQRQSDQATSLLKPLEERGRKFSGVFGACTFTIRSSPITVQINLIISAQY
jgi:hypothetical protein